MSVLHVRTCTCVANCIAGVRTHRHTATHTRTQTYTYTQTYAYAHSHAHTHPSHAGPCVTHPCCSVPLFRVPPVKRSEVLLERRHSFAQLRGYGDTYNPLWEVHPCTPHPNSLSLSPTQHMRCFSPRAHTHAHTHLLISERQCLIFLHSLPQ